MRCCASGNSQSQAVQAATTPAPDVIENLRARTFLLGTSDVLRWSAWVCPGSRWVFDTVLVFKFKYWACHLLYR